MMKKKLLLLVALIIIVVFVFAIKTGWNWYIDQHPKYGTNLEFRVLAEQEKDDLPAELIASQNQYMDAPEGWIWMPLRDEYDVNSLPETAIQCIINGKINILVANTNPFMAIHKQESEKWGFVSVRINETQEEFADEKFTQIAIEVEANSKAKEILLELSRNCIDRHLCSISNGEVFSIALVKEPFWGSFILTIQKVYENEHDFEKKLSMSRKEAEDICNLIKR